MTEESVAWDERLQQAKSAIQRADQTARGRVASRPLLILAVAALIGFLMGRLRQK